MLRWIGGLLAVAMLVGIFVGCGGGSDDTTPDVPKAVFVKKADFICADSKRKRLAIGEETFNPKQRQGSQSVGSSASKDLEAELEKLGEKLLSDKIVPSLRKQQEELESIGVPSADEEKVENMFASMEKAIDEVEAGGFEGLVGNQFDDFEKEAEAYGLSCKVI